MIKAIGLRRAVIWLMGHYMRKILTSMNMMIKNWIKQIDYNRDNKPISIIEREIVYY
ncbi:MAG: hypothetical protein ACRC0A_05785 [Chitinophagaceae bacterium]